MKQFWWDLLLWLRLKSSILKKMQRKSARAVYLRTLFMWPRFEQSVQPFWNSRGLNSHTYDLLFSYLRPTIWNPVTGQPRFIDKVWQDLWSHWQNYLQIAHLVRCQEVQLSQGWDNTAAQSFTSASNKKYTRQFIVPILQKLIFRNLNIIIILTLQSIFLSKLICWILVLIVKKVLP